MSDKKLLRRLARLYNVQTNYCNAFAQLVEPPPDAILRVLGMLGAAAEKVADLPGALRSRRQLLWQQLIPPVIVAWDGGPARLELRLPRHLAHAAVNSQVFLESGEIMEGILRDDLRFKAKERCIEGMGYVTSWRTLPMPLPLGHHRLILQVGNLVFDSYLIASPRHAYSGPNPQTKRWGLFCPLYALATAKSWGAGSFSDLGSLLNFAGGLGAGVVGTLPLFAAFLEEPYNPSPYAPVSRLFWNEFYLDVERIPELPICPAAKRIISTGFVTELEGLRSAALVDYRRLMALKRRVLEALLQCLLSQSSERRLAFERFVASRPLAQEYAAFRAKVERERVPWEQWPAASRDGTLQPADYDENARRYHLYVQWQAHEQMRALGEKSKPDGPALYLDFPLGVNRDGFDVWRERAAFALDASGGAPPDGFFTKGQNWGFPPLHPDGLRRQGYRYYINCVRHHLQHAGMLRIDHVMGLYRFYWVPEGFDPTEGVYVQYPAEEFFAVLNLESHRHQAQIVGENLGTVPPAVNTAMAAHKIRGMYVGQFGVGTEPEHALEEAPAGSVASLNTHDTPTFAAFWSGTDIEDRRDLGLLTDEQVARERAARQRQRAALVAYLKSRGLLGDDASDPAAVLRAWLAYLAMGNAELLLVNLEDLWLEPLPQNVPGTWAERPNWMHKARYPLERIRQMPSVVNTLAAINDIINRGRE